MTNPPKRCCSLRRNWVTRPAVSKMPHTSWACSLFTSPIGATSWKIRGATKPSRAFRNAGGGRLHRDGSAWWPRRQRNPRSRRPTHRCRRLCRAWSGSPLQPSCGCGGLPEQAAHEGSLSRCRAECPVVSKSSHRSRARTCAAGYLLSLRAEAALAFGKPGRSAGKQSRGISRGGRACPAAAQFTGDPCHSRGQSRSDAYRRLRTGEGSSRRGASYGWCSKHTGDLR